MSRYNNYGGVNCRECAMRVFQSDLDETDRRKVTYVKGKDGKLLPALPDEPSTDYVLRLNEEGKPEWGTLQAPDAALPDGGEAGDVLTMTEDGAAWIAPDELQGLLKMNASYIQLINQTRKCFNIDVANKRLVLSDWVILAVGSGSEKAFYSIPAQTVNWVKGDGVLSYQGYYFIVADAAAPPAIHVISQDVPAWPAMVNPVIAGVFYCSGENVEGLSILNDDVTVNGEYIYTSPPAVTDVLFAGSTRGCMNIDSVNKTLVLNSDAKITVQKSNSIILATFSIGSGSTSWYKGNALDYDGTYIVYADIVEADQSLNKVVAVRRGAIYVPAGDLYIIGSFDYAGTDVTGINFKNDVYVNGSYIYGGAGSGSSGDMEKSVYDADDDGVVDNADHAKDAEKLGGVAASGYMLKSAYDIDDDGVVGNADHADNADDAEKLGGVAASEYVRDAPDETALVSFIEDTNVTTDNFIYFANIANRTFFFSSENKGIKMLNEDTGEIVNTNITTGNYTLAAEGSNGKAYFMAKNSNVGIKVWDEDAEQFVSTNITSGYYEAAGIGSDGKTYFCSGYTYNGIKVLDDETGQIEDTNITTGPFISMFIGVDGNTYFVGDVYSQPSVLGFSFWMLNVIANEIVSIPNSQGSFIPGGVGSDGRLYLLSQSEAGIVANVPSGGFVNTNITSNDYTAMCVASNGKTYFCSIEDSVGIKVLNDATGDIEATNITSGYYCGMGIASDGKTYFLGSTNPSGVIGIQVLNDATGDIENTNVTSERYRSMGIGSDGKTYFCSGDTAVTGGNTGIRVLNDQTGIIERTNVTLGYYYAIVIGSDGKTYFPARAGNNGIKKLTVTGAGVCYVRRNGEWVDFRDVSLQTMPVPDYSRMGEEILTITNSGAGFSYMNGSIFVQLFARSDTGGAVHRLDINGKTVYRAVQPTSDAVYSPVFPIYQNDVITYVLDSGTFGEACFYIIPVRV